MDLKAKITPIWPNIEGATKERKDSLVAIPDVAREAQGLLLSIKQGFA